MGTGRAEDCSKEATAPFRSIEQDGILTSDDLNFLQEIYEAATADIPNTDDATMHEVAKTLIMYYRAGKRDKAKLIGVAAWDLRRAVG
jgi:hypothetical protein